MVLMFRFFWIFPYPNITINQAAIMTAVLGVVIPGLSALVAASVVHAYFTAPFMECVLQWWSSHTIGACLSAPPIILFSVKELKRLARRGFLTANIITFVAGLAACYVAIRYLRFPFVSVGLILLVASFRLGGFATSLMSLSFGLLITNLWVWGIRPLGLDSGAMAGALTGLPVIALLASLMPPIAVGIGSDARRAAVRGVQASERRFRQSMEHSPIGMLIADLNGVWRYTNIALQQMLGYTAAEFCALPAGGPSEPDDWMESERRWRRLLSGEIDFYDVTRRFKHRDGRWLWTHVAVSLLRDEDGSPLHLIAQIESLEARQQAEEKLAEERERLNITLSSISDAVITTDAHTQVAYINPAAEVLLGLDLKSVVGRRVDQIVHLSDPMSSKAAANLMGQSILHGKVFRREQPCLLHRPDGTMSYVTDNVSPVMDSSGAVSGIVIVFRDSTLEVARDRDLQFRALHDPLTGLSNRADFEQRLGAVFKGARHLNRPAAVIAIDLDRFKALNDAAGHAAGDAMLCKVGEACRAMVRSSDTIARLGGDEFAVILENCGDERAQRIGSQLLKTLNGLEIEWLASRYSIGASIGIAMCTMQMADAKSWLQAADAACYQAKRQGRGQLRFAERSADNVVAIKKI